MTYEVLEEIDFDNTVSSITIDFTSYASTYGLYEVHFADFDIATSNERQIQMQGNSSNSETMQTSWWDTRGHGTTTSSHGPYWRDMYFSDYLSQHLETNWNVLTKDGDWGQGRIQFWNPLGTTFVKHFSSTFQGVYGYGNYYQFTCHGYFHTTSALNSVTFRSSVSTDNFSVGALKVFGVL